MVNQFWRFIQATAYGVALCMPAAADSPKYFISSSGGADTNDGLSEVHPWKTVAKVNAASFLPGDVIGFKRGDEWSERLIPPSSGTPDNPIVFCAYGTGGDATIGIPIWTRSLLVSNRAHLAFRRLRFRTGVVCDGATNIVFSYCILDGGGKSWSCCATNGASVSLQNSVVFGSPTVGVLSAGTGTSVAIANCMLLGCQSYAAAVAAGGTIGYDYNLVCGNGYYPEDNIQVDPGITEGGHNLVKKPPNVAAYSYGKAYFCITIDDRIALGYATNVAAALDTYGVKLTLFLNGYVSGAERTALSNLVTHGNEVGVHCLSHSQLSATNAFTLYATNPGSLVAVDATNREIRLTCDAPSNSVTLSWKTLPKTVGDLSAAIVGKGWSLTNDSAIYNGLRLSSLADTGGTLSNFPLVVRLDVAPPNYPYWRDEILESIAWIATNTGVQPTTMAYPSGRFTPQLPAYLRDVAGLSGARQTGSHNYSLDNLPIYTVAAVDGALPEFTGNGSETNIRANARSAFVFSQMSGVLYALLLHDGGLDPKQVAWFVDEIQKCGGRFYTFGEAVAAIRADHASTDGLVFTEPYPAQENFRVKFPSVCIDSGADLGFGHDYAGTVVPVGTATDVGLYEYDGASSTQEVRNLTVFSDRSGAVPTPGVHTFPAGTNLTCAVNNSLVEDGTTQFFCAGWSLTGQVDTNGAANGSRTNVTLTLTNNATLTWQWATNYWLATWTNGQGGVDVASGWCEAGSNIVLTATPSDQYRFVIWTGTVNTVINPLPLTMDQAHFLVALFAENLATNGTPEWWLAHYGWSNDFNAAETNDADHDGMMTWQEWVAGTDPTNITSFFRFTNAAASSQGIVIRWPSISNRFYDLGRATNLMLGTNAFIILPSASNMPATPTVNSYTDSVQGVGPYFYKVNVRE